MLLVGSYGNSVPFCECSLNYIGFIILLLGIT
jgi:hypothetical protein